MRRKTLSRIGLATLLSAVALSLSGCAWGVFEFWGVTHDSQGRPLYQYLVKVHQANTDGAIHHCAARHAKGSLNEAKCVLDVIRFACGAEPIGWGWSECVEATGYRSTETRCRLSSDAWENCAYSMQRAIAKVRSERGEHLVYEHEMGEISRQWLAF